jgi:hypothetical protein
MTITKAEVIEHVEDLVDIAASQKAQIVQLSASLRWAMDEIDVLSNKLSGFAYPQGMAMREVGRESQSDNYVAAVYARRIR